jgi:hypothetical protein
MSSELTTGVRKLSLSKESLVELSPERISGVAGGSGGPLCQDGGSDMCTAMECPSWAGTCGALTCESCASNCLCTGNPAWTC